jgi:hypothetical protein
MIDRIATLVSFRALLAALVSATAVVVVGPSWPSGERRAESEARVGRALPRSLSPSTGRTFRAHSEARVGRALPRLLSPSRGRTFYVSKSGSDSSRGTVSAPWRTVQKALDTLRPGQRALVRSGTYREDLLMTRSGRASKPITLTAYPGARVVLRLASTTGDAYPNVFSYWGNCSATCAYIFHRLTKPDVPFSMWASRRRGSVCGPGLSSSETPLRRPHFLGLRV